MKLCFSTIGCPDWRLQEIVSAAKDLGYDAIEVRGLGGEIYAPAAPEFTTDFDKTKKLLEDTGLRIAMLSSGAALADHSVRGKSVDEAKAYIDLAEKVGAEFVRVMSTDKPYFDGGDIELCRAQYAEVVDYARGSGVTPLMETNGIFVDTAKLADFLGGFTGGGALWDVHHPFRFNDESVSTTVSNLGGKIKYVHLKDSDIEKGKVAYRMMGYGNVPVKEAIETLIYNGYTGYCTLEWVKRWNSELEDAGIVFAHYAYYMKRFSR